MTISPARSFLARELHRFLMLHVLTRWISFQTPPQPAAVVHRGCTSLDSSGTKLRSEAGCFPTGLLHAVTDGACWPTEIVWAELHKSLACPLPASATHSSLLHLRRSQPCRSLAKNKELLLPMSVTQQSIAFLWDTAHDHCKHRAATWYKSLCMVSITPCDPIHCYLSYLILVLIFSISCFI